MDSERKNVLFIVPSLARAGAEMQLVSLVNGLQSARFVKLLVWFETRDDLRGSLDCSVNPVHLMRAKRLDLRLARHIGALIDEHQIDVVHCTLLIALFYAWLGRWFSHRKPALLAAVHTTKNRDGKSEVYDHCLYRFLLRKCRAVVFVCEAQKLHWLSRFPELAKAARRIYNGIDTEFFSPATSEEARCAARLRKGVASDAVVCLCVAAMRPEKGHEILLDAMVQAHAKNPKLELFLAGDGALRSTLEQRTRELGLSQCVRFLGLVTDIQTWLHMADFTVLTSTAVETFSMAVLESLASGVPVVASDLGGAREVVLDGETGYVVPPGDRDALAGALVKMSADPASARKLGMNGRQLVRNSFDRETMISAYDALLADL
jgi:glycosyltransferase involved in cell wall biosynthesis